MERLGPTLGAVLYQLPPSLPQDLDRLEAFIKRLPDARNAVFEFRHPSWYDRETFDLLNAAGAAFCIHDMVSSESPRVVTGETVYVRFHGTSGRYARHYTDAMLADWADWLGDQAGNVRVIYAYFNNDVEGHAIRNAQALRQLLDV